MQALNPSSLRHTPTCKWAAVCPALCRIHRGTRIMFLSSYKVTFLATPLVLYCSVIVWPVWDTPAVVCQDFAWNCKTVTTETPSSWLQWVQPPIWTFSAFTEPVFVCPSGRRLYYRCLCIITARICEQCFYTVTAVFCIRNKCVRNDRGVVSWSHTFIKHIIAAASLFIQETDHDSTTQHNQQIYPYLVIYFSQYLATLLVR